MAETKRKKKKMSLGRGQPAKAKLDTDSIIEKIEFEMLKGHRDVANNIGKYLEILNSYALGELGASPTNQLSSIKYLLDLANKYVDDYADEEEGENSEAEASPSQQKATGTDGGEVIRLIAYDE